MRYTQLLIDRVRRHTGNTDIPSDDDGIDNQVIIDYLNDGIALIQSLIYPEMPDFFGASEELDVVAQQESYILNGATFFGDTVAGVEYSEDGSTRRYRPLRKISPLERINEYHACPNSYFVRGGRVFLSAVPNAARGKIRVTYSRMLNKIDLRRGNVASATVGGDYYTEIVLESSSPTPVVADFTARAESEALTVVDADGVIQHANIPFSSFSTLTATLPASTVLTASGTISAGDYVVFGEYATTHSELPPTFEPYLVQYANRQILANEESSIDVATSDPVLQAWTEAIISAAQSIDSVYSFPTNVDSYYA